jgi:hypothetical protein
MQPAEFIDALSRHYGKRHNTPDEQGLWLKEMIGIVKGIDHRVLAKAYELIRDNHEERAFPLPATIRRYAIQAAEIVYPERMPHQEADAGDWNQRAEAAEKAMSTSPMGIAACHEGWANGLREFLVAKRRFPHRHEIQELRENAAFIDRCSTGDTDLGIMHKGLVQLAGKMIERRHAIADRVLGRASS